MEKNYNLDYKKILIAIIGVLILSCCVVILITVNIQKQENPASINIEKISLFTDANSKYLKKEINFKVVKTKTIAKKQEISVSDTIASYLFEMTKTSSFINDMKGYMDDIEYYSEVNNIEKFCIPEKAGVSGIDKLEIYSLKDIEDIIKRMEKDKYNLHSSKTTNMHVYNWNRTYKKKLSEKKYNEWNIVLQIDNKMIHEKITFEDNISILSKCEMEILLYELDN